MGNDDERARRSWKITRSHRAVWKVSEREGRKLAVHGWSDHFGGVRSSGRSTSHANRSL
jgi:hypothetical protein